MPPGKDVAALLVLGTERADLDDPAHPGRGRSIDRRRLERHLVVGLAVGQEHHVLTWTTCPRGRRLRSAAHWPRPRWRRCTQS
jgi:hypothetical protein